VPTARALSEDTLGAWLVKASPAGLPLAELVRDGFEGLTSRCVHPTYRAALVREGQPVLLWVSGRDRRHPAGIYARGRTTGPATDVMPLRLVAVHPVVTRDQVREVPGLATAEVLRMPAGSNPSFLDVGQYHALTAAFPQLATG
jgi:hypothetical protein